MLSAMVVHNAVASEGNVNVTIKNDSLEASYSLADGTLSLRTLAGTNVFIPAARLLSGAAKAGIIKVQDPVFGKGMGIGVVSSGGKMDEVMLFRGLPFVLIRRSIANTGSEPVVISREETFAAILELGSPASELSVITTDGFQKGNKGAGSYAWIAVARPFKRNGVVAGWISNDIASGVLFSKEETGKILLTARSDFGTLRINPGKTRVLETLAVGYFDDARIGLEKWADTVARVCKIKLPAPITGYCTWYHARASDEKSLVRDAGIAAEKLKPYGFDFIQIDDGWQAGASKNGPHKDFTRVAPNGPYKGGMKPVADAVKGQGFIAGIWFMPFSGNWDDPWFGDKQDFWYRTKDGKPYETNWSGTMMDMSNPKALAYLREEVKRISDWGYRYFKMDGLHSGLGCKQTYPAMGYTEDNFGDSVVFNKEKTNIEIFRDALKMVRETAARDTFLLGCCCPQNFRSYSSSFGLVDAMRIGPDNGGNWNGWLTSPRASTVHYFLNGRIWYNDPDPVYLREGISMDQVRAMCSWQGLSGSLTVFSDSIGNLSDERLDVFRRIIPSHTATARPVDILENDERRIWLVTDTKGQTRRDVIGIYNWTGNPVDCVYDMGYIGLEPGIKYAAYEFWTGRTMILGGKLEVKLLPASCMVLAVRPLLERPFLLSTSRHVTQGMVDVAQEMWVQRTGVLSGRSSVVGKEPYELRIVAVSPWADWTVAGVSVSSADSRKGVKIEPGRSEKGLARFIINAPASREVSWSVKFVPMETKTPVAFGD